MSLKKWRRPIFEKKNLGLNLGKLGPNLPKFEVSGHFLEFESLDFFDFAYYDRRAWYLADSGGVSSQKKYLAQKRAVLGLVSKLFLSPNSFSRLLLISFFWYCILWQTAMISSRFRWCHQSKKNFWPKKGHFRACLQIIFVSKFIFLTFTHYFFWYCILW